MEKKESLFLRLLLPLDEKVSVKLLLRVWGPRFEFAVRLILVATFLDDSFRAATSFSEHTKQLGEQAWLVWLAVASPELVSGIATVALSIGLLAQLLGSLCLLALVQPDAATKALIGWAVAQPVLYSQTTNLEFVAESLSLVGGLLMLRAALQLKDLKANRDSGGGSAPDGAARACARTQLFGRLLLPAVYMYHTGHLLFSLFDHSLSMFVVNCAVLVGLALGCTLMAAGLKSRTVALSLALVNLVFVCYQHPFFGSVWREGAASKFVGEVDPFVEWKLRKSMPHVAMPMDISAPDFEPWQITDPHRYYFFQGLSASGALLLLAQFGPGEIAVQEDEVLLPVVQRAQD